MRVAVVGCGAIARRAHIPAVVAAGATVTVVASRSAASAEAAATEAGGALVVGDWEEAVTHPEVDAVLVCTPNHLHEPVAVAAAGAGRHVLVEKPLAPTVAAADRMLAAARDAGVALVPAHNVRFAPPFVAAAAAVRDGAIGEVTGVRAAFGHAGPEHWAPEADWFRDPERSGGGALLDLGVHVADLLRAVTGRDVVRVAGASIHREHGGTAAVDDDAQVLVELEGGARGSFHASWIARPGPDHQLTVFGTDGTLHLDGRTPLTRFPGDGGEPERLPLPPDVPTVVGELLRAAAGEPPAVTAADGRAAVAIVAAAYRAAAEGRAVEVER